MGRVLSRGRVGRELEWKRYSLRCRTAQWVVAGGLWRGRTYYRGETEVRSMRRTEFMRCPL